MLCLASSKREQRCHDETLPGFNVPGFNGLVGKVGGALFLDLLNSEFLFFANQSGSGVALPLQIFHCCNQSPRTTAAINHHAYRYNHWAALMSKKKRTRADKIHQEHLSTYKITGLSNDAQRREHRQTEPPR